MSLCLSLLAFNRSSARLLHFILLFNHKLPTALYFFFSTSCSATSLALFAWIPKSQALVPAIQKLAKQLQVLLLCDDTGCLLLVDILYDHDWSCQLGGQPEFFSRTVFLVGAKGLGKRTSGAIIPQLLHVGLQGVGSHSASLDPKRSQWSGSPFCGCQSPLTEAAAPVASTLVWYLSISLRAGWVLPQGAQGDGLLAWLALCLQTFRTGWLNHVAMRHGQSLWKWGFRIMLF